MKAFDDIQDVYYTIYCSDFGEHKDLQFKNIKELKDYIADNCEKFTPNVELYAFYHDKDIEKNDLFYIGQNKCRSQ